MIDDPPEPIPEEELLFSSSLLSKWGFADGDQLEWISDHGKFDRRAVLIEVVKRHLVPKLEQAVEFEVIITIHNPIRAVTVNGEDMSDIIFGDVESTVELTPEYVSVPGAEILAIAKEVANRDASES